jgi:hypothetical protein
MHEGLKCPFRDISECHLTILAFLDRTFQGIPKMLRAGGQQLLMDGILMHIGAEFDLNDRGAYVTTGLSLWAIGLSKEMIWGAFT